MPPANQPSDVAGWLMTKEGVAWAWHRFDRDATVYHDIIELIDDLTVEQVGSHAWFASAKTFARVKEDSTWRDLDWDPDLIF